MPAIQWRITEITLPAASSHAVPYRDVELTATFTGPDGRTLAVPGFWDGGSTWKVRITPTLPGAWRFVTACPQDSGLHGRTGSLDVVPANGDTPLHQHGGFLRVSDDGHYLTYTDGTPFFWLGDTWWFCPSKLVPLEGSSTTTCKSTYKTLIDTRRDQGYSVVQMAFLGPKIGADSIGEAGVPGLEFWQEVDRYLQYANNAGILPVIGFSFHSGLDNVSLDALTRLWRYIIARYGAFAVTWLICGEYNQANPPARVEKVLALGAAIKALDPYRRAMTVHPWWYGEEGRQAWEQPWYDFIMLQGGHPGRGKMPPVSLYLDAYNLPVSKPVLEAECNYENIFAGKPNGPVTAVDVRRVAYRAMQAGSFGFTYGAHGLWYPTQNAQDATFNDWGTPTPWWEALAFPGGVQMRYLRACYESVAWWKLKPCPPDQVVTRPPCGETERILAKGDGDREFLVYFPPGVNPTLETALLIATPQVNYRAYWFNPRNGEMAPVSGLLQARGGTCLMPPRPDRQDWMLIMRRMA